MTAEPNSSMTTDQALAMLKKMKYMTPNPAIVDAVSVLTQEIERLTEALRQIANSESWVQASPLIEVARRACDWRQA